jgi:hypothetical protein
MGRSDRTADARGKWHDNGMGTDGIGAINLDDEGWSNPCLLRSHNRVQVTQDHITPTHCYH